MNRSSCIVSLAGTMLIVAGCGSKTLPTTFPTAWETPLDIAVVDRSHISEDGSRILVGSGRELQILGDDGTVIGGSTGEAGIAGRLEVFADLQERGVIEVQVGRHPTSSHSGAALRAYRQAERNVGADVYSYRLLPDGTLLVFEPRMEGSDLLWGFHLGTARGRWLNDDYAWSASGTGELAAQAVQEAASRFGRVLASRLGGEHQEDQGETGAERAERLAAFASGLVEPMQGGRTTLLKTTTGLALLDTETGRARWSIDGFRGTGMVSVIQLAGGHAVVVGGNLNWLGIETGPNRIARVDLDRGELVWQAEYDGGGRIDNVLHDGSVLLVDGNRIQAFALDSGEKLWEQEHTLKSGTGEDHSYADPVLVDGRLFVTGDVLREDVRVVRTSVPRIVRGYDARTGAILWTTESAGRDYPQILATDRALLVTESGQSGRGAGAIFALDRETGAELWRSEEFDAVGLMRGGSAIPVSEVFVSNGVAHVAGQNAVYGFDVATGAVRFRTDHREAGVGTTRVLLEHGDALIVLAANGVAGYARADGSRRFAVPTGSLSFSAVGRDFYTIAGNTLWLTDEGKGTTGIDLRSGGLLGTAAPPEFGDRFASGDLGGGQGFSPDGLSLYQLGEVCERRRCTLVLRKLTAIR